MTEEKKDNIVFIGSKPLMAYVNAVQMQFKEGQEKVQISARGKNMNAAIDVEQIITQRFMKDEVETESIKTGSEEFNKKDKDGKETDKKTKVSTLDIILKKK